jgi:hypothetical protein
MKTIYSTLLILITITGFGQGVDEPRLLPPRNNSLMANLGFIGLYATAGADYSRRLGQQGASTFYASAGGALFDGWGVKGHYYKTGLTWLVGRQKGHLELSAGAARIFNRHNYELEHYSWENEGIGMAEPEKSDYWRIVPTGSIGYRFQNPYKRLFFRTGIGYPESGYLGMGWRF